MGKILIIKWNAAAAKFGILASTLSMIMKNREILAQKFKVIKRPKKSQKCTFLDIEIEMVYSMLRPRSPDQQNDTSKKKSWRFC